PVRAKYLWEDLALSDHFDFMIVSCHLGATKPQPDYFQKADVALNRTHTQPILFLDDLKENIIGARSHGWIAHHVKNSDHAIEVLSSL
ncbi:MAG: HAD-IA family hydrolase, partial [Opitutaceae bacterium]|nr:HAD-IA family hydrolase [Opitutaceae bacterium]